MLFHHRSQIYWLRVAATQGSCVLSCQPQIHDTGGLASCRWTGSGPGLIAFLLLLFRISSHCKCCCSLSSSSIFDMDVLAICSAQPAAASSQCRHPCCLWLWAGGQGGTGQFQPEEKAGGWEAVRGQLLRLLTICLKVIRVCAVWLKKYD